MSSEQKMSKENPSGSSSSRSSGSRGRRGRSRRPRAGGPRKGNSGGGAASKKDYLPSDEALAAEEANMVEDENAERLYIQELKGQTVAQLAVDLEIENASGMRRQELFLAVLRAQAERRVRIVSQGVLEVLPDGFGFLRSPFADARRFRCLGAPPKRRSFANGKP